MIGLGEPVLDALLRADSAKDVWNEATFGCPVMLDEQHAVVGQHRVDPVRNGVGQGLEKARGDELGRLAVVPGEHELGSAVHGHEQKCPAAFVAQLGDIDVEIADLVGLEQLGLLAVRLGQAGDPMPLKAPMERRARQVRDDILQGDEDAVQWQTGLHRTRSATMAASSIALRTELRRSFGPIGWSSTLWRERHFLTVFSLSPYRLACSAKPAIAVAPLERRA